MKLMVMLNWLLIELYYSKSGREEAFDKILKKLSFFVTCFSNTDDVKSLMWMLKLMLVCFDSIRFDSIRFNNSPRRYTSFATLLLGTTVCTQ